MSKHDKIFIQMTPLLCLLFVFVFTGFELSASNSDTIRFDALNWQGTPRLGMNYVILFNTSNPDIFEEGNIQPTQLYPLYRYSEDDPMGEVKMRTFEFSYYNVLGVFGHIGIAQANLFGSYPTETQYRYRILYSNEIIQAKQSIVNSGGDAYDLTGYQYVFNKRPQYLSAGIYFSPIKHFFLKAGMASIKADQFQVFVDEGGQYRPYLQDYIFEFAEENVTGLDTYVTNPRKINK